MNGGRPFGLKAGMVLIALALAGAFFVEPALAQQYPPPTPTAKPKGNECATPGIVVENGGRERFMPRREFRRGDTVAVRGAKHCVPQRTRVDLYINEKNQNTRIGASVSSPHGAYTVSGQVPPRASIGSHKLTIVSAKRRHVTRIEVVPGSGGRRRTVATGTLLATWAALAAIVGAYALTAIRKRRTPVAATAVPDAEMRVPAIDTWDFIPLRSSRTTAPPKSGTAKRPTQRPESAKKPKAATKPRAAKVKKAAPKKAAPKKAAPKADAATGKSADPQPSAKATPTRGRAGSKAPKAPPKTVAKGATDEPTRKPPKKR